MATLSSGEHERLRNNSLSLSRELGDRLRQEQGVEVSGRNAWRQGHEAGWLELQFGALGLHPSYLTLSRIPNCTEAQFLQLPKQKQMLAYISQGC